MASPSSHRFPFDDDDRPSGSVRPLSQADLQAILAHLSDDPDQLLAGTSADRPVVALRVRASVGRPGGSAHAIWRQERAAEWATWTRTLPWRVAATLGVGAAAGVLGSLLAPRLSLILGGLAVVAAGWGLRFRPSPEAVAWRRGAVGERRSARLLAALERHGWAILHDLAVPGSRANLDHLAIGPGGVFVIDSKQYRLRNTSQEVLGMNLDDVIPNPHHRMCHSRIVGAPPTVVWDELYRVTMSALPLGRALEGVRLLPARLSGRKRQSLAGRTFLDVTPIPVLFSERPHVVISAGLSQAWRLLGGSTPPHLDAAALRAWSQPAWIKVGMEFRLEPIPVGTLLSTETRVLATDPRTRRAFAASWFFIRAGSGAIRREVLRTVAHRAESPLKARRPGKSRGL